MIQDYNKESTSIGTIEGWLQKKNERKPSNMKKTKRVKSRLCDWKVRPDLMPVRINYYCGLGDGISIIYVT